MAKKTLADLKRHESVHFFTARRMMATLTAVESHPERYDQRCYGNAKDFDFEKFEVKCNSACCFAGHAVALLADIRTQLDIRDDEVAVEACRVLGLPVNDEGVQNFFDFPKEWPDHYKTDGEVTVENVRQRVEHYIETGDMW